DPRTTLAQARERLLQIDPAVSDAATAARAAKPKLLRERFPFLDMRSGPKPAATRAPVGATAAWQPAAELPENVAKYTGEDMTGKAAAGKWPEVVGRDDEIDELIEILTRPGQNNAAILGSSGSGKTTIVRGLAQRIVRGNVPDELKNARIAQIDLNLFP